MSNVVSIVGMREAILNAYRDVYTNCGNVPNSIVMASEKTGHSVSTVARIMANLNPDMLRTLEQDFRAA